jgi:GLPGLI family protein
MMKKSNISLLILFFCLCHKLEAQKVILQGKITYERKENLHKQIEEDSKQWYNQIKNQVPKYRVDYMQLSFNNNQSLYTLLKEEENKLISSYYWRIAFDNVVMKVFKDNRMTQQKTVYEKIYLIEDSIPQYEWKITGEYREIAGFNCRKATTILYDSMYVIAFYTEEIPVSSGPESFSGLPGMILGVVIPMIHYTFFAISVEGVPVSEEDLAFKWNKKSQSINQEAMLKELDAAMKDWGKYGRKNYWKVVF